jgi:8-oxo-dGTP pyrophosphatase MutT (NUDIX family)
MLYECTNCGKQNHTNKNCSEPMSSIGIVCIKLDNVLYNTFIKNLQKISYYNLNNIIMNNIHKFNKYNDSIKFLLVNRRNSLNYIDFIRGKYNINDIDNINKMCSYMSSNEINMIKNKDFNILWSELWLKNAFKKKYLEEMKLSKIKFNYLKNLGILDNIKSEYNSTEWEIPKGRKNLNETNLKCAIREFKEETYLSTDDYTIISCLDPIHDIFIGTNDKEYRHIFYTALYNNNINNNDIIYKNNEIEEIRWCSWSELNELIRPYNNNKINILTNIFLFILNICETHNSSLTLTI